MSPSNNNPFLGWRPNPQGRGAYQSTRIPEPRQRLLTEGSSRDPQLYRPTRAPEHRQEEPSRPLARNPFLNWRPHDLGSPSASYQPSRTTEPRQIEGTRSSCRPHGSTQPGDTTTDIRPGDPHHYGTRLDRRASRLLGMLCKCNNPRGHGDAFAYTEDGTNDINGKRISWKEMANRMLAHHRRTEITWEQMLEAARYIMHPEAFQDYSAKYREVIDAIRRGAPAVVVSR